jgi:hypothetical protein
MRKECWAIESRGRFVQEEADFSKPVRTLLFRTRLHAIYWLEDNPYWVQQKAKPVKVRVSVEML